jgi:lysophospholipase L1-like esterase
MQQIYSFILGCVLLAVAPFSPLAANADRFEKWEPEIKKFEAADKAQMPPQNANLFVGSSSIRLWTNLTESFPKHQVIGRGFGGSTMEDLLHFADRLILVYQPKQVFVYEGDNDLAANRTPESVVADFKALVEKVHHDLPKTKIYFIAVKPSPSRWKLEKQAREVNDTIAKWAHSQHNVEYIDVWTPMLGKDGRPRPELFREDNLHMNATGYEIWRKIIEKKLR